MHYQLINHLHLKNSKLPNLLVRATGRLLVRLGRVICIDQNL